MNRDTGTNRHPGIYRTLTVGVVGLAMLTLTPLSATARGWGRGAPSPDEALARLTERLDLTDEQQEQVLPILEESFERRREVREEAGRSRAAMREQMEEIREETHGRLAEILTAEQMEELEEMREERRERRGRERGRSFDE